MQGLRNARSPFPWKTKATRTRTHTLYRIPSHQTQRRYVGNSIWQTKPEKGTKKMCTNDKIRARDRVAALRAWLLEPPSPLRGAPRPARSTDTCAYMPPCFCFCIARLTINSDTSAKRCEHWLRQLASRELSEDPIFPTHISQHLSVSLLITCFRAAFCCCC